MSALDDLLSSVEAELHLVNRNLKSETDPIRSALDSYERAVQEKAALQYCQAHSLKRPPVLGVSKEQAAGALLEAVKALPELGLLFEEEDGDSKALERPQPERPQPEPPLDDEISQRFQQKFPALSRACLLGKLLVFGAFAGRTKNLPGPLGQVTEWIDTATDGNRLVSSATKRIKAGNVFAVIICDQAIQHQHATPVSDAARSHKVPIGYAGKGGNAALARALESLEKALA